MNLNYKMDCDGTFSNFMDYVKNNEFDTISWINENIKKYDNDESSSGADKFHEKSTKISSSKGMNFYSLGLHLQELLENCYSKIRENNAIVSGSFPLISSKMYNLHTSLTDIKDEIELINNKFESSQNFHEDLMQISSIENLLNQINKCSILSNNLLHLDLRIKDIEILLQNCNNKVDGSNFDNLDEAIKSVTGLIDLLKRLNTDNQKIKSEEKILISFQHDIYQFILQNIKESLEGLSFDNFFRSIETLDKIKESNLISSSIIICIDQIFKEKWRDIWNKIGHVRQNLELEYELDALLSYCNYALDFLAQRIQYFEVIAQRLSKLEFENDELPDGNEKDFSYSKKLEKKLLKSVIQQLLEVLFSIPRPDIIFFLNSITIPEKSIQMCSRFFEIYVTLEETILSPSFIIQLEVQNNMVELKNFFPYELICTYSNNLYSCMKQVKENEKFGDFDDSNDNTNIMLQILSKEEDLNLKYLKKIEKITDGVFITAPYYYSHVILGMCDDTFYEILVDWGKILKSIEKSVEVLLRNIHKVNETERLTKKDFGVSNISDGDDFYLFYFIKSHDVLKNIFSEVVQLSSRLYDKALDGLGKKSRFDFFVEKFFNRENVDNCVVSNFLIRKMSNILKTYDSLDRHNFNVAFPKTSGLLKKLFEECRNMIIASCFYSASVILQNYHSQNIWAYIGSDSKEKGRFLSEMDFPTPYMISVNEYLLNLLSYFQKRVTYDDSQISSPDKLLRDTFENISKFLLTKIFEVDKFTESGLRKLKLDLKYFKNFGKLVNASSKDLDEIDFGIDEILSKKVETNLENAFSKISKADENVDDIKDIRTKNTTVDDNLRNLFVSTYKSKLILENRPVK